MINLNNGGCSPAPSHVLEQMIRDLKFSNELPTEHMWRVLEPRIESVRRDLAKDFGCDPEEMAITRNASEANETMIFGIDLKARRRSRLHDAELSAHAERVDAAAAPRRHRPQAGQDRDAGEEHEVVRRPDRGGDHAAHARDRGDAHQLHDGLHRAGARARRAGEAEGHSGLRRRGARVRALPVHARRARRRLLRHQPPQVDARADRHRLSLRPPRQDQVALAAHGRWRRAGSQHPEVRGDRHASGREPQRDRGGHCVQSRHRAGAEDRAAALPPRPMGQPPARGERSRAR